MNKITKTQLESTQLKRLAAQRQLYTDAKNVQKIQGVLNILGALILAVCVNHLGMPRVYAICYVIIVPFLNILWLTRWQKSLQKKAAGIQELFDCDVLELDWREIVAGPRLGVEIVEKYALKHKRKDPNYLRLKDWYAKNVGDLPLHVARIACQRENCSWTAKLHLRYRTLIIVILVCLTVLTIFIGIKGEFSVEKFIVVVIAPLTPVFILGIPQCIACTEAATRIDKLKNSAVVLWEKALERTSPEELTNDSRILQDAIYNNRRENPLILDSFYKRFREKDEELMYKTAEELANSYKKNCGE
jgi:hypothetical protein